MFGSNHYIPILKWKGAEQQALQKLTVSEKKFITPLIQIIMPTPKLLNKEGKSKTQSDLLDESLTLFKAKLPEISEQILKYWGETPAFIDLSLIDSTMRKVAFSNILKSGKKLNLFLIPVVRLNSDILTQELVISLSKVNKSGLCLRLFRTDFTDQKLLENKIDKFLSEHKLSEKEVDILVDFQITDGQCLKLKDICQQIPNIQKWRTFTFASGSFPTDLNECTLGKNYIERSDWNYWLRQTKPGKLSRTPSFSDYTIQHPIHIPSYQFFLPSASIRYTLGEKWLVMRGQKRKYVQYLANAQLLSKEPEFFGSKFSYGDAYIEEKGKNLKGKPGNATTWLVAGFNHHLVCTVSQLANLS
jgi:hypothetical protein